MRRFQKGTNPPGVGGGGRKVKKKCIDRKKRRGTASKGVGLARGTIRQSTRHRPGTRCRIRQLMDSRSGLGPHRRRGARKRGLMKVSIIIAPFYHFTQRISPLLCFTILPCELVCIFCTISP